VTDREVFLGVCTSEDKSVYKRIGLSVRLVYVPMGLSGVTTARSGVAAVLQMVSEPTLVVSRACTGQLRRIR
jgi:predicted ABC-type transport system involved in lysophospholipase L1 biosynthesis ATPase subunit